MSLKIGGRMSREKEVQMAWAIKFVGIEQGQGFDNISLSETAHYTGGHTPRLFRYKYLAKAEIIRHWKPQDIPAIAVRVIVTESSA